ncbi:MAG: TraB/GumN family protein [Chitinophagaceae bacterium]|nr:TraB/GumN family protein [Chitinophagaceae bacterium]
MRIIFCFLLCINLGLKAQPTSLLWEISGKGLQSPSYLFGSFHLMCSSDFQFQDAIKEKINRTKQFYGEVDMSAPNLQQELVGLMMLQGTSLDELMGTADFKKADSIFNKLAGIPLKAIVNFKPFMASSMLALQSIPCTDKVQPETRLMEYAQKLKLPIKGLETIQDQMNAIDSQPLDSQVIALKQSIFGFDSIKTMMLSMINLYKTKNPDSLYHFIKSNGGNGNFEAELLIKRNKNWIPVIIRAIQDKPSFFVVGAGHLAAETGIIALLRKEGYTLKPMAY